MCTGYTTGKQYDGDDDDDQKNSKRVCSRAYIKVGQRRDFILRDTEGRERGGSGRKVWRKKGRKNKKHRNHLLSCREQSHRVPSVLSSRVRGITFYTLKGTCNYHFILIRLIILKKQTMFAQARNKKQQ